MKVKAVFIQEFYELMGRFELEIELAEGATVRDLIEYIDSQVKPGFKSWILDEKGEPRYPVEIAVNGRRIDFLDGLETRLKDGDRVLFSPRALFVV
ncbi:MoaD/ThiS family protein [Hyperthermus butylicus]|uniref:Conserved archaeal protein n=1 Tax=Hyperthermus butylicus (strain DSM 5456 / JCM 9403 / PLM1-5) TaxID=415426 RepID=A2BLK0_HYPBU|nr:MoaD/ThiS family protein [Hyperthermus butylicus]ABM80861.1 conserved archaeal protein [Hyperthermus butylicus DSM 5456]